MAHEYPKNFARFYDLIYHPLRDEVDQAFFLDQIDRSKGKILEVGVGTGRFFIDAINNDNDIYGIDISPEMINIIKSKLKSEQHHRISNQNIIDFNFDDKFDLIIAPFRVIMHVIDKEEQLKALNNVYDHLEPGGKFIFDTFVPDMNQLINGLDNFKDFEGEYEPGHIFRRFVSTRPDLVNQIIHIHFRVEWEEENTLKHEDWKLPFRFFFRFELEHLIERSKFGSYEILGDYEGNKLNEHSKEFILVCHKK